VAGLYHEWGARDTTLTMAVMAQSRPLALITGGGTGIGAATATRLAAAGFDVLLAGRRLEPLTSTAARIGAAARHTVLDVTDPEGVGELIGGLDRLDVVVNNAGGALGLAPVAEADAAQWRTMFEVNVLGTLNVVRAALPLLLRSPRATIVDISSTAGEIVYEGGAGYAVAKHGTSVISETLRLELSGTHVRVVDIRPGMVATDEFALTRFGGDAAAAAKVYVDVDRPLVADDVAACVEFAVQLPQHVNIDTLTLRPVAQAAQHKTYRGPIDWHEG